MNISLKKDSSSSEEEFLPKKNSFQSLQKPVQKSEKNEKKTDKKPILMEKPVVYEEEKQFDPACKYEFPSLPKPPEPKKPPPSTNINSKKKINTTSWDRQNANPFLVYQSEDKVSQKALAEEFPSLAAPEKPKENKKIEEEEREEEEKYDNNGKKNKKKKVVLGGFF